jgi:hypothetical protein
MPGMGLICPVIAILSKAGYYSLSTLNKKNKNE